MGSNRRVAGLGGAGDHVPASLQLGNVGIQRFVEKGFFLDVQLLDLHADVTGLSGAILKVSFSMRVAPAIPRQ